MDYTAAVFPISDVGPTIDVKKLAHVFLSEADKFNYDLYDPEKARRLHCSWSAGLWKEGEAVIAMSEIVDAAVEVQGDLKDTL